MKKNVWKMLCLALMLSLAPLMPLKSVQAEAAASETTVQTGTSADGWVVAKNGKKRFYKNGKYLTGTQKIEGKVYYFEKNGYMKTGWKKFSKGYSYFDGQGVRVTGVKKISKKYYYFNKSGIKKTGITKVGKNIYFLDSKGVMKAQKLKSKYYSPSGKKLNKTKTNHYKTLETAKKIVDKITTSKMSKSAKLKACFDWVIRKPYVTRRRFSNVSGWPAVYANDHFKKGGGNCFSDASAFAYLARALGYEDVYVCVDCDGSGGRGHSWAMIGSRSYDPLFAETKSYSGYYGTRSYPLQAIIKIKL